MKVPPGWHHLYVLSTLMTAEVIDSLEWLLGKSNFYLKELNGGEWLVVTEEPITAAQHESLRARAIEQFLSPRDREDEESCEEVWEPQLRDPSSILPPLEPADTNHKSSPNRFIAFLKRFFTGS